MANPHLPNDILFMVAEERANRICLEYVGSSYPIFTERYPMHAPGIWDLCRVNKIFCVATRKRIFETIKVDNLDSLEKDAAILCKPEIGINIQRFVFQINGDWNKSPPNNGVEMQIAIRADGVLDCHIPKLHELFVASTNLRELEIVSGKSSPQAALTFTREQSMLSGIRDALSKTEFSRLDSLTLFTEDSAGVVSFCDPSSVGQWPMFKKNLKRLTSFGYECDQISNAASVLKFQEWISLSFDNLVVLDLAGFWQAESTPIGISAGPLLHFQHITTLSFIRTIFDDKLSDLFYCIAREGRNVTQLMMENCSLFSKVDRWAAVFDGLIKLKMDSFDVTDLYYADERLRCPAEGSMLCAFFEEDTYMLKSLLSIQNAQRKMPEKRLEVSFCDPKHNGRSIDEEFDPREYQ